MCTHHLVEAEGLADQVVMLEDGTDLISGKPAELARRYWAHRRSVDRCRRPQRLDLIAGAEGVTNYGRDDGPARVQLDALTRIPELVRLLTEAGRAHHTRRAARTDARRSLLRCPQRGRTLMTATTVHTTTRRRRGLVWSSVRTVAVPTSNS
jgi:ABC-type multidrug transport system ATPase subunit